MGKTFIGSGKIKVDKYQNSYMQCWMYPKDVETLKQMLTLNLNKGIAGIGFKICPKKLENVKNGNTHYIIVDEDTKTKADYGKTSQATQGQGTNPGGNQASAPSHRYSESDLPPKQ
jgi:hypothetical protein